jgi:probable rRNA maturation factor
MHTKLTIDIQYASAAIEASVSKAASATLIKKWVKAATSYGGLLTLRFVNAGEGKKLNLAFRKKEYTLVADIIFCLPVIQKEAKEQNKVIKAHLAHLIVHGCLHAQAYDHEVKKEAEKMEALEVKILHKLGFTNPYLAQ